MIKRGANPTVFILSIIFTCTLAMCIFTQSYITRQCNSYIMKVAAMQDEILSIPNEMEQVKDETTYYKNIINIKNRFNELSGNRYAPEEVMRYSMAIAEESERYGIEPALIMAVIATESSFKSDALSDKGAIGMMQLLPATAFYIADQTSHIDLKKAKDLYEPEINLRLGTAYLAYLVKKTGSMKNAIIAYNYGPVNLKRAIEENRELPKSYVNKVLREYKRIASAQ